MFLESIQRGSLEKWMSQLTRTRDDERRLSTSDVNENLSSRRYPPKIASRARKPHAVKQSTFHAEHEPAIVYPGQMKRRRGRPPGSIKGLPLLYKTEEKCPVDSVTGQPNVESSAEHVSSGMQNVKRRRGRQPGSKNKTKRLKPPFWKVMAEYKEKAEREAKMTLSESCDGAMANQESRDVKPQLTDAASRTKVDRVKRRRGRPFGSKNRPKRKFEAESRAQMEPLPAASCAADDAKQPKVEHANALYTDPPPVKRKAKRRPGRPPGAKTRHNKLAFWKLMSEFRERKEKEAMNRFNSESSEANVVSNVEQSNKEVIDADQDGDGQKKTVVDSPVENVKIKRPNSESSEANVVSTVEQSYQQVIDADHNEDGQKMTIVDSPVEDIKIKGPRGRPPGSKKRCRHKKRRRRCQYSEIRGREAVKRAVSHLRKMDGAVVRLNHVDAVAPSRETLPIEDSDASVSVIAESEKRETPPLDSMSLVVSRALLCLCCNDVLPDIHVGAKHRPLHSISLSCRICEAAFVCHRQRYLHEWSEHKDILNGERDECKYCFARFPDRTTRKKHETRHNPQLPFDCRFCELSFKNIDCRFVHEAGHTNSDLSTLCMKRLRSKIDKLFAQLPSDS